MTETELSRSQTILKSVFKTRKYSLPQSSRIVTFAKGQHVEIWTGVNAKAKPVVCCFILGKDDDGPRKLLTAILKSLVNEIGTVNHVIFVSDDVKVGYQAMNYLRQRFRRFEVLSYAETQYNILESQWVPTYRRLTQTEIKQMTTEQKESCHRLLDSDPVSRILGLRAGDFVKAIIPCYLSGYIKQIKRVVTTQL